MDRTIKDPEAGVTRTARTIITVIMDVLVAIAIALTARIVILFFGSLYAMPWAKAVVSFTSLFVLPLHLHPIRTPYGGVFDLNAAVTIVVVLLAEWALSAIRSRD